MTRRAYLTIDDSPSTRMDDLVAYLKEKKIPALFFCRGDLLEENPIMAVKAVQEGFVLGNHGYAHERASETHIGQLIEGIEKTDRLINHVYQMADLPRPGKFFRFPHLDRGCASWVVDYDAFEKEDSKIVKVIFTEGLNIISGQKPTEEQLKKKEQLQAYLKERGFSVPFAEVSHEWYKHPEIAESYDCLYTYSTCDWMLTKRHENRWRYKTLDDLRNKIGNDKCLRPADSCNIILAHDQAEIIDTTIALIDHLANNEFEFLDFKPAEVLEEAV